ncbi:trypsin domain-containing protein [Mycobacteroides abscessus subsp. abscessus]|uniref:hypothetical protein n=1 Tax=Mycobacteroides abscessus TaxID=36809 RepID=UPI00092AE3BA|nr:hypothetical protein [Mycobacteroides abscessus]SIG52353.1 trypsin domain-containing protein [Mycobacteroides abscessus subsp. abscessus]
MNRNMITTSALTVAAVTLAACATGPTEPKPWPSATASAEVSAAAAASTAPAPQRFEWVDVTGQGIELPRDVREHTMYSPQPAPGAKILHVINAADDMNACTIGPAVVGAQGRGFLTGATCTGDFGRPLQYLQTLPGGGIQGWAEAVSPGADAAVIWSSRSGPNVTRIAGTWPIAGLLTAEGAYQLVSQGAPVCIFGATSGVVCGAKRPDAKGLLQFDITPGGQDNGAPAFVVDKATRTAVLLGIYRRGAGVAALDPSLGRLGAKVLLDPTVKPLTGDGFSEFVTVGGN